MNEESTIIEKLNYLEGTKTSIKNAIISKGQEVTENDTFRSYAQKIANIETGIDTSDATATAEDIKAGKTAYVDGEKIEGIHVDEDLTSVLNAQDQKIAELEEALENKTAGGEVKLNIYCQETEPTNKDGIWLQTNKKLDNYIFDNDIVMEDGWGDNIGWLSGGFCDGCATLIADTLWVFGLWSNWNTGCRYNLVTGDKSTFTTPAYCRYAKCVAVGTDIYIWVYDTNNSVYKYDTLTGTSTQLTNFPISIGGYKNGTCILHNGYIYIATSGKYYKYDYINDTYTLLATHTAFNGIGDVYNGHLYLLYYGSSIKAIYKIDIESGNVSTFSNLSVSWGNSTVASTCIVNGLFYIYSPYYDNRSKTYECYVFDINSKQLTSINNAPKYCNYAPAFFYNGSILVIGGSRGTDDVSSAITKYNLSFKQFEDNSVIISQKVGYYKTVLIYTMPSNVTGLLNFFNNVWYYNNADGLDDTIPTYYGDGTQWIKFKN